MSQFSNRPPLPVLAALAAGIAVFGFLGSWAFQASGLGRGATERLVRNYILENPEILPEAVERLQQKETLARLEPLRDAVETPFEGAVLGNPEGSITLVEFTDYACPYCRLSLPDLKHLIDKYSDLKVVVRENPVFLPGYRRQKIDGRIHRVVTHAQSPYDTVGR